jgi:HD-like signal output (HDOD) protein
MANAKSLKDLLTGAQLPALPQSALRLLELSQDPNRSPSEFAVPIEGDPGLAGQVLRFVNSSYFGFSREISSVKLALQLVGIRTIKNFALWSAVFSLMPNPKCGPFDLRNLWVDSLRRGLFARAIGKALGVPEAEDLFAAGLLQDMAVPVLAKEMPAVYEQLLTQRQQGVRLSDLERQMFGWDHAAAGATMARMWSLPESFARLIEHHTALVQLASANSKDYCAIAVALSALTPGVHDETWHDADAMANTYQAVGGAQSKPLTELFKQVDAEFADIAPILKLPTPSRMLSTYLEAAATTKAAG